MKVAVLGQGFIGAAVIQTLKRSGHNVLVLPKFNVDEYIVGENPFQVDLEKESSPDYIVNCAWIGLGDYSSYTCALNSAFNICVAEYLGRIWPSVKPINLGSCWEYYHEGQHGSLAENECPEPQSFFSFSKQQIRLTFDRIFGSDRTTWLRLFYVFGEGQREKALIPSLIRAKSTGVFECYSPANRLDYIYVYDVAAMIEEIVATDSSLGICNVGSGSPVETKAIISSLLSDSEIATKTSFPNGEGHCDLSLWADVKKIRSMKWFEHKTGILEFCKRI